jgi:hypothetical protein
MLKRILILLGLTCSLISAAEPPSPGAGAAGNAPSDASIKQLLSVTEVQKMQDQMLTQMDSIMKSAMQQATHDQKVTPEVQKDIDKRAAETIKFFREELAWNNLEPMYVRVYQKSYTQKEVDDLLAFYQTPTGQSFIKKQPVVSQNMMADMQQRMGPMMRRIEQMRQEVLAEIRAGNEKKG